MKNKSSILIIIVFFLFMLLPQIGLILNIKNSGKKLENRKLAQLPKTNTNSFFSATFGKEMNKYVWDHFPLRSSLLKLDHWIDYHVFSDSPVSNKVILGNNKWLFFYNSIADWPKNNSKTINYLKKILNKIANLQNNKGIKIIIMPSPSKASIYPEFLPQFYRNKYISNKMILQNSLEKIALETNSLLLLWKPFMKRKKKLLKNIATNNIEKRTKYLFRPRDSHFQWETSLFQTEKVIEAIAPDKWKKNIFSKYFYNYRFRKAELDKRFLKLKLTEPYKTWKAREFYKGFNVRLKKKKTKGILSYIFTTKNSKTITPLKLNLVVIYDSFFLQSKFLTAPFFTKTTFIRWGLYNRNYNYFMKKIKEADIILIQSLEDLLFQNIKRLKIIDKILIFLN